MFQGFKVASKSEKGTKICIQFLKPYSLAIHVGFATKKLGLGSIAGEKFIHGSCSSTGLSIMNADTKIPHKRSLSTNTQLRQSCEGSSRDNLLTRVGIALKNHKLEEAWEAFTDFKRLYGLPVATTLSELITGLSYSSDCQWLKKAYTLVTKTLKDKPELIKHDALTRLCLSLARAQMVVPASKILRLMLWRHTLCPMDTFSVVVMHLVKTQVGTCLASNILLELCDHNFQFLGKRSDSGQLPKPSTRIFNLVLDACVRFQLTLKGQKIIELMAKAGVVADVESVLLFSSIYERNGQRDQLKKFRGFIDKVPPPVACHYRLFYDKLLNLHFKFSDLDAAGGLVEDMHKCWVARLCKSSTDFQSPCFVPIGSQHLKDVLQIQFVPELLQKDSILLIDEGQEEFVSVKSGRLVLSNRGLAQIIIRYKESLRIGDLSKLVIDMQNSMDFSGNDSLCCDVIVACVHVGWLDTAHDILDDMNAAGVSVPSMGYKSLLAAYCKQKMFREAEVLAEQMKKSLGMDLNVSDGMLNSECPSKMVDEVSMRMDRSRKSELAEYLVLEMKHRKAVQSSVYEFNCSIDFFCKAKMMEDASKAYQNMQKMKIPPTAQTYFYLIEGYSSLGMYREITILWGDMKRNMKDGVFLENLDLYESLLLNFIRGRYFERVLEIISRMEEQAFYADKWKCKNVYLTLHKNLYRNLKESDAKTEAQRQRLEHVQTFRKWLRA